jgi:dipeptidyl-peptidase 4
MASESSFPRQFARTLRFTLGAPRAFTVSPDGQCVVFLRSASGTDRAQQLWALDLNADGLPRERLVVDPQTLLDGEEDVPAEERARRERSREGGAGVVAYATDADVQTAVFALSGRLFVTSLRSPDGDVVRELDVTGPVVDPRLSPEAAHVAYVHRGALRVVTTAGSDDRALAEPDGDDVTWGLAEFVAAEEMHRFRGFWWSPEGDLVLAARVDSSPVQVWWIANPADPGVPPTPVRYPAAGTANADVTLALLGLDGSRLAVEWDRTAFPYLAEVQWRRGHAPLLHLQSRDQRRMQILAVDVGSGGTRPVHTEDAEPWIELCAGVPGWTGDGRLAHVSDVDDARVLTLDGRPVTDPTLFVRSVLGVGDDDVLLTASSGASAGSPELGEVHVYRVDDDGPQRVSDVHGVHTAARSGDVTVLSSSTLEQTGAVVRVLRAGKEVTTIASHTETPVVTARPRLTLAGERRIPAAVVLPTDYQVEDGPLPVLMDPYGGPHGQRVVAAQNAHLTSQWLADQGFAVVVADGRGTPGRSVGWEKSVHHELAAVTLEDQVAALHALADEYPLDLDRVGIRGWSFGGYLAALAVLRRPDVFHAAVVGAPVSDLRLYDTHYQERYLGLPHENPDVYARNSLVTDAGLSGAADVVRPMMVIHGLADDNVVVAHSLRLSSALLAEGRPHEVIPLSGVTHMTPQEQVAENLLLLQVDFLHRALARVGGG